MTPKFVNCDMFLDYWGKNLNDMLRDNDNASLKADTFLARVELRLMAWIDKNTFRNVAWNALTAFQIEKFQYAILEQAMYMWSNGDIANDSGYDQDKGIVAGPESLERITVCQPCINYLVQAGLFNLHISNRKRWLGFGAFYTNDVQNGQKEMGVINKDKN